MWQESNPNLRFTLIKWNHCTTFCSNIMTSLCFCFPCYNVFGCFSLKETEHLLNIWCKIYIGIFFLWPYLSLRFTQIGTCGHCYWTCSCTQFILIRTITSLFWNKIPVFCHFIKRETRIYFSNLKQINIINSCNYIVEPRCAYTKQNYNPLVLKNVVFSADGTFLCRALWTRS